MIVVALDRLSLADAVCLAAQLGPHKSLFALKIHDLFLRHGEMAVAALKQYAPVWVDLKFNDIPATVAAHCKVMEKIGADHVTVHASAGPDALIAALEVLGPEKVIAITVLTSLDDVLSDKIYGRTPSAAVRDLARMALQAGIQNFVCSPFEVVDLPQMAISITPGIRPLWYQNEHDDQKRATTPAQARGMGADHIVIGRPIVQAESPMEAMSKTAAEWEQAGE